MSYYGFIAKPKTSKILNFLTDSHVVRLHLQLTWHRAASGWSVAYIERCSWLKKKTKTTSLPALPLGLKFSPWWLSLKELWRERGCGPATRQLSSIPGVTHISLMTLGQLPNHYKP
jgi:hypothetical protein